MTDRLLAGVGCPHAVYTGSPLMVSILRLTTYITFTRCDPSFDTRNEPRKTHNQLITLILIAVTKLQPIARNSIT